MVGQVCAGKPGIFVETGDLNTARFSHTATLLPNGKVLVAGGMGVGGVELGSTELYDSESGTWMLTGSLVNARDGHHSVTMSQAHKLCSGRSAPVIPRVQTELMSVVLLS